jgi:hypothetical protein
MLLAGFEPTISAGERSQTYALDRADNGTGDSLFYSELSVTFSINRKVILTLV